jgi:hypothetical protein
MIRQAAAEAWPLYTKSNIDTGQPSTFQAVVPQAAIDYLTRTGRIIHALFRTVFMSRQRREVLAKTRWGHGHQPRKLRASL